MTTYNKIIIEKNKKHILQYYTRKSFVSQVKSLICRQYPTPYHAVLHMVEGGCFLIYYFDVNNYLEKKLGLPNRDSRGREYSDVKSWELYCHLLARDGSKLYYELLKK